MGGPKQVLFCPTNRPQARSQDSEGSDSTHVTVVVVEVVVVLVVVVVVVEDVLVVVEDVLVVLVVVVVVRRTIAVSFETTTLEHDAFVNAAFRAFVNAAGKLVASSAARTAKEALRSGVETENSVNIAVVADNDRPV